MFVYACKYILSLFYFLSYKIFLITKFIARVKENGERIEINFLHYDILCFVYGELYKAISIKVRGLFRLWQSLRRFYRVEIEHIVVFLSHQKLMKYHLGEVCSLYNLSDQNILRLSYYYYFGTFQLEIKLKIVRNSRVVIFMTINRTRIRRRITLLIMK